MRVSKRVVNHRRSAASLSGTNDFSRSVPASSDKPTLVDHLWVPITFPITTIHACDYTRAERTGDVYRSLLKNHSPSRFDDGPGIYDAFCVRRVVMSKNCTNKELYQIMLLTN